MYGHLHNGTSLHNPGLLVGVGISVFLYLLFVISFSEKLPSLYLILFIIVGSYSVFSVFFNPRISIVKDPFQPLLLYKIVFVFSFLISPIVTLTGSDINSMAFAGQLFVGIYFLISIDLVILFFVRKRRILRVHRQSSPPVPYLYRPFLFLYLLSWCWRLYALTHGIFYGLSLGTHLAVTPYSNLLGSLNHLGTILFFAVLVFSKKSPIIFVILVLEIIWCYLSGSKAFIISIFLPFLLIMYRRGFIKKSLFTLRMIAVYMLLLFSLASMFLTITKYRVAIHQQVAWEELLISEAAVTAFTNQHSPESSATKKMIFERILQRLSFGESLYRLFAYTDSSSSINYWYGRSYLPMFVWFVPRFLWPEKPYVSVGKWFGQEVLGWSFYARSEGAITFWGDAYMNFGWFGVLLFTPIMIYLVNRFYNYFRYKTGWHLLFFATVYMRLITGLEQNLSVPVIGIQMSLLIIFGLWCIAGLPRKIYTHWRR